MISLQKYCFQYALVAWWRKQIIVVYFWKFPTISKCFFNFCVLLKNEKALNSTNLTYKTLQIDLLIREGF